MTKITKTSTAGKTAKIFGSFALACALFLTGCKKSEVKPEETAPIQNYTNFKILSMSISAMPFLDSNSSGWDPNSGPDVFFNITNGSAILLSGSSSKFTDVQTSQLPMSWTFTNAHQITNITATQFIEIWDYDTIDPNDYIGSVGFKLEDHKSGYPKTITKTSGGITVSITGEWY